MILLYLILKKPKENLSSQIRHGPSRTVVLILIYNLIISVYDRTWRRVAVAGNASTRVRGTRIFPHTTQITREVVMMMRKAKDMSRHHQLKGPTAMGAFAEVRKAMNLNRQIERICCIVIWSSLGKLQGGITGISLRRRVRAMTIFRWGRQERPRRRWLGRRTFLELTVLDFYSYYYIYYCANIHTRTCYK